MIWWFYLRKDESYIVPKPNPPPHCVGRGYILSSLFCLLWVECRTGSDHFGHFPRRWNVAIKPLPTSFVTTLMEDVRMTCIYCFYPFKSLQNLVTSDQQHPFLSESSSHQTFHSSNFFFRTFLLAGFTIRWPYHLQWGKVTPPIPKSGFLCMTLNCIWWWGSSSWDQGSVEYSFIAIWTPLSRIHNYRLNCTTSFLLQGWSGIK